MAASELALALVRASHETGCSDDGEEVGFFGLRVGDIRALASAAHGAFDWHPIATAPKDGDTFLVYSEESRTYDFAEYDIRHGEFVKHGCGWPMATQWALAGKAESQTKAASKTAES